MKRIPRLAAIALASLAGCGGNTGTPPSPVAVSCVQIIGGMVTDPATGKARVVKTSLTGRAYCDTYTALVKNGSASFTFTGPHYIGTTHPPFISIPGSGDGHTSVASESRSSVTFRVTDSNGQLKASGSVLFLAVVYPIPSARKRKH